MLAFVERHVVACLLGAVLAVFLLYEATALAFAYSGDSYVDADVILIAPQLSGPLSAVKPRDDSSVEAGGLIAELDKTPFALTLATAQAEVALAEQRVKMAEDTLAEDRDSVAAAAATFSDASSDRLRIEALFRTQDVSAEALDNARQKAEVASADLKKAQSVITVAEDLATVRRAERDTAIRKLDQAKYDVERTRILSPVAGRVAPLRVRAGDYARAGEPVAAVVSTEDWRITAEVSERHLYRLRVGQTVWFTIGSDPWRVHVGKVRAIAPGVARREAEEKALPYIPLDIDWVRLARRFPVIIDMGDLPKTQPLYRGADARVLIWF